MKEKIAILWMCICLLPSCFDNHSEPGGGQYTGEETEVAFLPKANGAIPTADEVTGIEKVLQEIDIIVCDNEGKYLYYRNTWLSDGVYRTTLKAQENVTLHFIANSRSILEAKQDILVEGSSWEDNIRPALIDTRLSGIPASLPMWNVLTHVSIEDGVTKNLGTIYLLRSVAAVEVEIDETIGESIFKLEQVSLYYAPSAGLIAPLPANYDSKNDIYIFLKCLRMLVVNKKLQQPILLVTKSLMHSIYMKMMQHKLLATRDQLV
ncbi:MAG: hypothetical protein LIP01_08405 [Tannerellaceae bacterium]|nr:hypothetical protein [Tannerellaceae bacterium]